MKQIQFKVLGDVVELSLDDFKWLIGKLFYTCDAVGGIPSMDSITVADEVLQVLYWNNLNQYIDAGKL